MYTFLIKFGFFILSIAIIMVYYNQQITEIKNTIAIEINTTNMNKIDEVFKDLKFLEFHSAVKKIEFIEQIKKEEKLIDIYEITEEAKVLGGLYNFYSKNKINVHKINSHNFLTNIRMKIMGFFNIEFNTEFIAFLNENKNGIIIEERKNIKGPSLLVPIVAKVADDFHTIMFKKMKDAIEK